MVVVCVGVWLVVGHRLVCASWYWSWWEGKGRGDLIIILVAAAVITGSPLLPFGLVDWEPSTASSR